MNPAIRPFARMLGMTDAGRPLHPVRTVRPRQVPAAHVEIARPPFAHIGSTDAPPAIARPTSPAAPRPGALAMAIIAAGKKRRGELAPGPNLSTEAGRLAALILRAGRLRRSEPAD